MPIGAKILDAIDEAIRLRDKVLLILSEDAIASDWVEDEVTKAFDEERRRKRAVLFPIRLDDAVMETNEAWARLLRGSATSATSAAGRTTTPTRRARATAARPEGSAGWAIRPVQSPRSCPCARGADGHDPREMTEVRGMPGARGADQGAQKLRRRGILPVPPCVRDADPMPSSPPRSHRSGAGSHGPA